MIIMYLYYGEEIILDIVENLDRIKFSKIYILNLRK